MAWCCSWVLFVKNVCCWQAREARTAREAMKQANAMRGTTMQTITKVHKLKTMNKKQLRTIKKTAMNAKTGQLELVSPWSGKKSPN